MEQTESLVPTRETVRGWSEQQRAEVARMLDELSTLSLAPRRSPRRRRLVLMVGTVGALGMLPWLVYLSITLPASYSVGAWRTVWVGFDVALFLLFTATAASVWLRRQIAAFAMVATATVLICDAWFDTSLSWGAHEHWSSIGSALIEVPVAVLLASSATTLMRRTCTLVSQLRGQDPTPVSLWKQPMLHRPSPVPDRVRM